MLALLNELVNVVVPVSCAGCAAWDTPLCPRCAAIAKRCARAGLIESEMPMRLISLGEYEGALRRIILTAKHDRANNLQGWLLQAGGSLAKGWLTHRTVVDVPLAGSPLLIVPVPSQWTRWWRGLMVTPHIARGFASHLEAEGIDVMVAPVLTKAWGSTQAGKSGAQRRARSNTVSALVDLRGAQCILVDDVVTTGATMLACRRAVEYAGGHCFVGVSLADVHNCRPLK